MSIPTTEKQTEKKKAFDKNPELIRRYREGDAYAGEEIVILNRPLVCSIASRFVGRGVDTEDLIAIGNIGLVKAINTFDFSRECAFSTYAVPLIFGEIRRFLRDDGMIKVSREEKRLSAIVCAERERRAAVGESLALSEIAGVMPVMWNQSTPSNALSQSMSPGFARAMAEYARSYTTLEGS